MQVIKLLLPLLLSLSMNAQAGEKAVYVGEGRYACDTGSIDCAVLKQRNEEQTRRVQESYENEQWYEREERRESRYQREYETDDY
ncbi:hypothetical protein [Nitrosospira briensis]|uniref:hypothetical protein n=1 Tax=Nitrosospira briensis TaxID=35799 RepID=UPI0008E3ADD5|nr:hypothetical protein [Nitrosospira briensis]SFO38616.1 hypothetical protein SAMN05216332_11313 [Nitrosospira briensis]